MRISTVIPVFLLLAAHEGGSALVGLAKEPYRD